MLELKDIKKDYITSNETVQALKGISIKFRENEFVAILGQNWIDDLIANKKMNVRNQFAFLCKMMYNVMYAKIHILL